MFGSIAFIGLGKMGYPMSQRLINYKQLPLRVWTRSQEKLSHHVRFILFCFYFFFLLLFYLIINLLIKLKAKHLGSIPCVDLKETIVKLLFHS